MQNLNGLQIKKKQEDIIKQLKQQVHKSFLQISQMQKLYTMELQHTRRMLQQKQEELRFKQQQLNKKFNESKSRQGNFMIDLGNFDDSNLLDEISFKAEPQMKDSNLEALTKMLTLNNNQNRDVQQEMRYLKQLQRKILLQVKISSQNLSILFKKVNDYCIDNFRLKQQLINLNQTNDIYKRKIQQNTSVVNKLKFNETKLKNQIDLLQKKIDSEKNLFQAQIKSLELQNQKKNKFIQQMKEQISKLIDLMKHHQIKPEQYNKILMHPKQKKSNNHHDNLEDQKIKLNDSKNTQDKSSNLQRQNSKDHQIFLRGSVRNNMISTGVLQSQGNRGLNIKWRKSEKIIKNDSFNKKDF